MKYRTSRYALLLVFLFHSFSCVAVRTSSPGASRALNAVPAQLNIDMDGLATMEVITHESLTYRRVQSMKRNVLGVLTEIIWMGADGPFLCILVQRSDGAIAGQFTTETNSHELLTNSAGALFTIDRSWGTIPSVFTRNLQTLSRNNIPRSIDGELKMNSSGGGRRELRRLQDDKTTVNVLVLVLNRAMCEQGRSWPPLSDRLRPTNSTNCSALLTYPCSSTDANKAPIEARISLVEAQTNLAMETSGIPVEVQVGTWIHLDSSFDVDASVELVDTLKFDKNVALWRAQSKADLVVMITGSKDRQFSVASRSSGFASAVSYDTLSFFSFPRVVGYSFGAKSDLGYVIDSRLGTLDSIGCPSRRPCPIVNTYSSRSSQWSYGDYNRLIMGDPVKDNAKVITANRENVANLNREISNDLCLGAFPWTAPTDNIFTTVGAIEDFGQPECGGIEITAPGVWFSVVGDGEVSAVSTCRFKDFSTKVSVYTGSSCGNLECVAANSGDGCPGGSTVSWSSSPGTIYYILVHGLDSGTGSFQVDFWNRKFPRPRTLAPVPRPSVQPIPPRAPMTTPTFPTEIPPSPVIPNNQFPVRAPPPLCFSARNTVVEKEVGEMSIAHVRVGDSLQIADGTFSRVFSLAHYDPTAESDFIQILTGNDTLLELTGRHLVFVNNTAMRASTVQVGDYLGNNMVTTISLVKRRGLFAPLTESGTLLVNGMRASSYVDLLDGSGVVWNQHTLGQLLFSPIRMFCRWDLQYCASESHNEAGYSNLYSWLIWLVTWIGTWGPNVSYVVSAMMLPFFVALWLLEQASLHRNICVSLASIVVGTLYATNQRRRSTKQQP